MTPNILFRPGARQEFNEICNWYERHRDNLGQRFESRLNETLRVISESPLSFPVAYRDVRRALVRPFPYGIYYLFHEDIIHVLAVMHGHRDPKVWKSRLEG